MVNNTYFTRITLDTNGNPRYVIHFLHLLTKAEKDSKEWAHNLYDIAVKRANEIGGRKYHTKAYGGGIVFQSYSLTETSNSINDIVAKSE